MPAYIDKVANVSGMLKNDPDLLLNIASITKPRVFRLTPFLDGAGDRRCQIIGKGSHSLNDSVAAMSKDKIEILNKQLDYSSIGPCEGKFLNEDECAGYTRCAQSFLEWAEDKDENTRLQAQELAETLRDCAEYENSCRADPSILQFHWKMKTLHRRAEHGGGSFLTYDYHQFNPAEHFDPEEEAERLRVRREVLRQVGHAEQKEGEEEEEESMSEEGEDEATREADRLLKVWELVEKSKDEGLTEELPDFNLEQAAVVLEQRKQSSVTVSKDVVKMTVSHCY